MRNPQCTLHSSIVCACGGAPQTKDRYLTCHFGHHHTAGAIDGYTCTACSDGQFVANMADSKCTVKRNSSACSADAMFVAGKAAEKTKDDTVCTECGGGDYKKTPTMCAPKRTTCPPGE